jgi:hypothetical protein
MKRPAARLAAGLALVLALTAAASYAAVRPGAGHGPERHAPGGPATSPPAPIVAPGTAALRIPRHPPAISTHSTARFRVDAAGEPTLRCRLDQRALKECDVTPTYPGLGIGTHTFYVQAQRGGRVFAHASYSWTILEPKPFTVAPLSGIGPLYPGAAARAIPVIVSNPNPIAITVTALRVTATGNAAGCDAAANLSLTAPALGGGKLRIAAHDSVSLPSATIAAPTISLRELDVDQDACKGASFDLAFSGDAGA